MAATRSAESCSFDDFLELIGSFGFYQKRLVAYMFPFFFLWAFVYLTQIFLVLTPNHWCQIPELQTLSKEMQLNLGIPKKADNSFEKCVMYDTDFTEALKNHLTTANTSWDKKSCNAWVYDRKEVPYESIATELNWVCQNDKLGPLTVVFFFVGAIIGKTLFGIATDYWGRIPGLMLANACGLIGGVATSFCSSFLWFSVARGITGLALDNCAIAFWILAMELVSAEWRAIVTNLTLTVYFIMASVLLPWIALLCNDWRLLSLVTSLPIIINLLMYFFLDESPRWLIGVKKVDKAMRITEKIAKSNGKSIPYSDFVAFQACSQILNTETKQKFTFLDLFKRWRICHITIISMCMWMSSSLIYDGHIRSILALGSNVFLTFTIAAFIEFPACLVPMFFLDIIGRKLLCFIALLVCAIGSFAASVLTVSWQQLAAAVTSRFCATITFNVGIQWVAEMMPTVIRGQGVGFIQIMGFVALLLSPYIAYTGEYSKFLPMFILGIISILSAILTLMLPETTGKELPQKPDDVEIMFGNQPLFSIR